jgi:ATP-binding cassette subfamily B protein
MKELRFHFKYFKKYKYRILFGIVATILSRYFLVKSPKLIGKMLNIATDYFSGKTTDLELVKASLTTVFIWLVIYVSIAGVFMFLMRQAIIVMSRLIEYDLKNEIYNQYQRLSLDFYKRNSIGDLMNRISEDVNKARMYIGPALMYSINTVTLFVIVIYNMIETNRTLTAYALLPLPFLSFAIYKLSSTINKKSTAVQQYLSKLTSFVQEHFSGITVIKSYALEDETLNRFSTIANTSKNKNLDLVKVQALFFPFLILLMGISNIIIIYVGGKQYIAGEIEIGVLAEFILFLNMLTWPVMTVGWITSIVQQAEASQKRVNEFLKEQPTISSPKNGIKTIQGSIAFKKVSFTYIDTGIEALKNISFKLNQGETLGIIGNTGSGKSTLLALIARLYDANEGELSIDKNDIQEFDVATLRSNMGYVPQDAFLFSETIADNIRFGKADASQEEIMQAAKMAQVHDNIMAFSKGYDTLLGERGVTLSGGQKQRVSIARALIGNKKILLFDDCLSAVDTKTEEQILKNIETVSKNSTTIIVSHRISSVLKADKIIVLKDGAIIQEGNHQELMSKAGYYKDLYKEQLV